MSFSILLAADRLVTSRLARWRPLRDLNPRAKRQRLALASMASSPLARTPGVFASGVTWAVLLISNCGAGVHSVIGSVVLDSISVTNCFEGVGTVFTATFSATNLLIVNSLFEGIHSEGTGSMTVTNATVYGGGNGVYGFGNLTLRNSIVANTRNGVEGTSTTQVLYSNIFNNLTNYVGVSPGTGTISQNPLFVAAPTDLRLLQGSPSIDTGDPTNAAAHDLIGVLRPLDGDALNGAAFDMGAFEYVRPVLCGDGLVEGSEECDDANTTPGDGCAADCTVEPFCGDGTLDDGEECDDATIRRATVAPLTAPKKAAEPAARRAAVGKRAAVDMVASAPSAARAESAGAPTALSLRRARAKRVAHGGSPHSRSSPASASPGGNGTRYSRQLGVPGWF
jgi:cysteine-rich repeat protein